MPREARPKGSGLSRTKERKVVGFDGSSYDELKQMVDEGWTRFWTHPDRINLPNNPMSRSLVDNTFDE